MIPKAPEPSGRYHISHDVDGILRGKWDEFRSYTPAQLRNYLWKQGVTSVNVVPQYPADLESHWLLVEGKDPAPLHVLRPCRKMIADEMGVSIAQFQEILDDYIIREDKALYQKDYIARCPTGERCINPSHLVVCTKDGPYIGRQPWMDPPKPRPWKPTAHVISIVRTRITMSKKRIAALQKEIRDLEFKIGLTAYQSPERQKDMSTKLSELRNLLDLHTGFQKNYLAYTQNPTEQGLDNLEMFVQDHPKIFLKG